MCSVWRVVCSVYCRGNYISNKVFMTIPDGSKAYFIGCNNVNSTAFSLVYMGRGDFKNRKVIGLSKWLHWLIYINFLYFVCFLLVKSQQYIYLSTLIWTISKPIGLKWSYIVKCLIIPFNNDRRFFSSCFWDKVGERFKL